LILRQVSNFNPCFIGLFSWLQIRRYIYVESDIITFSGKEAEAFLRIARSLAKWYSEDLFAITNGKNLERTSTW